MLAKSAVRGEVWWSISRIKKVGLMILMKVIMMCCGVRQEV